MPGTILSDQLHGGSTHERGHNLSRFLSIIAVRFIACLGVVFSAPVLSAEPSVTCRPITGPIRILSRSQPVELRLAAVTENIAQARQLIAIRWLFFWSAECAEPRTVRRPLLGQSLAMSVQATLRPAILSNCFVTGLRRAAAVATIVRQDKSRVIKWPSSCCGPNMDLVIDRPGPQVYSVMCPCHIGQRPG